MSFITAVNARLKQTQSTLKKMADQQVRASQERAKLKMDRAATKAQKLQAKAQADREKARIYKELREAQQASVNAAAALKKARIEAGDLTASERLQKFAGTTAQSFRQMSRDFQKGMRSAPPRRRVVRKKTVAKRRVTHR